MSAAQQHDPRAAAEIFYDGGCPVCRREIAACRRLPGLESARWTDVTAADAALPGIDRDTALARFHVQRRNGELASGARAFLAVWRGTPRPRWLALLLDRRPLSDLMELGYRCFLKIRPLWR